MESQPNSNLGFYYDKFVIIPSFTFHQPSNHENILILLNDNDLTTPPSIISKQLDSNKSLAADIKAKKVSVVYGSNDTFVRAFIAYESWDEQSKSLPKIMMSVSSKITRILLDYKIKHLDIHFPSNISEQAVGLFLNGFCLTNHKFERKGTVDGKPEKTFEPITSINIGSPESLKKFSENAHFTINTARYTLYAREMQNERANIANTAFVLERVKEVVSTTKNLTYTTIIGKELQEQGLNLLYSVGKASASPPALICLKYEGNQDKSAPTIAIVGKGILFDAGGLNIKTSQMEDMFYDKSGAMAVLAAIKGCSDLNILINVVATLAMAENFIGPDSYRPSDIIQSLKGLTVEVLNTDAEGRLVLADAMTWTQRNHKPKVMIELSTLTGAVSTALGSETAGIFSNHQPLVNNLIRMGAHVDEAFWHLPITDEHRDMIKATKGSDLVNTGLSAVGSCGRASAFLEQFVEEGVRWAHLDIAGANGYKKDKGVYRPGAVGFGVKTVLHYLREKSRNGETIENDF